MYKQSLIDEHLPFRFAAIVPNDTNVADFAKLRLFKETKNLLLFSLKVNARHKYCAIVTLCLLSLTLRFFKTSRKGLLALAIILVNIA